jgi:4-hydroxy-3-methylbut-2-enyl diphosphate reductase
VNSAAELPDDLSGRVGVTAGASAPDELVEGVIAALDPKDGVVEVRLTDEDEYFPPPRNLRDLVTAVDVVATFMLGASTASRPALNDRTVSASNVLEGLAAQPRTESER